MFRPLHHVVVILALACLPVRAWAQAGPDDLRPGQRIKIEGVVRIGGPFVVRDVALRDPDSKVKIEGAVKAVDAQERRLALLGFTVVTDSDTSIDRGSADRPARFEDVAIGQRVEVKGLWDGSVFRATRLRLKPGTETDDEIEAEIESVDLANSVLVVLSRKAVLPRGFDVDDERTAVSEGQSANRLRRDDDEQQPSPIQVGNWLTVGGRFDADYLEHHNLDLDDRADDRTERVQSGLQLQASASVSRNIELYTKARVQRGFSMLGSGSPFEVTDLSVDEAYVYFRRLGPLPFGLQVGRQRFRDGREWMFDDYLDGVRVHVDVASWKLEAAVTEGIFAGPIETQRRRDQRHFILSANRRLPKSTSVTVILLGRDDRVRREKPIWLGAAVTGRVTDDWRYWVQGAARRGQANGFRLGGWAADVGGTYQIKLVGSPSLTLGYAMASGDTSRADGLDTNFRQTGLEDNSSRFGGLKRIRYYGELFDPELSNMQIMTAGLGLRPADTVSIDLVLHRYQQHRERSRLASHGLEAELEGSSRDLGEEADLFITIRIFRGVDIGLVGGLFFPGRAFTDRRTPAFIWKPELRFYF
jgi:alginate production protein